MRNQIVFVFIVTVVIIMFCIVPVLAGNTSPYSSGTTVIRQQKTPSPETAALQNEITRLQRELDVCRKAANNWTDTQRGDAIKSLYMVRNALETGADLQEFKKYQIESGTKIDLLPNVPEDQIIKDISDLYRDAVIFGTIGRTGIVSDTQLTATRKKYSNDRFLIETISSMKPNDSSKGPAYKLNRIDAETFSKLLILQANMKLEGLNRK